MSSASRISPTPPPSETWGPFVSTASITTGIAAGIIAIVIDDEPLSRLSRMLFINGVVWRPNNPLSATPITAAVIVSAAAAAVLPLLGPGLGRGFDTALLVTTAGLATSALLKNSTPYLRTTGALVASAAAAGVICGMLAEKRVTAGIVAALFAATFGVNTLVNLNTLTDQSQGLTVLAQGVTVGVIQGIVGTPGQAFILAVFASALLAVPHIAGNMAQFCFPKIDPRNLMDRVQRLNTEQDYTTAVEAADEGLATFLNPYVRTHLYAQKANALIALGKNSEAAEAAQQGLNFYLMDQVTKDKLHSLYAQATRNERIPSASSAAAAAEG